MRFMDWSLQLQISTATTPCTHVEALRCSEALFLSIKSKQVLRAYERNVYYFILFIYSSTLHMCSAALALTSEYTLHLSA